jgi:Arc/MetJ-type ribon-helix-helix transcriptional regulator
MEDDDHARQERARRLREEIESLKTGREPPEPPASPREFIEQQMREEDEDNPVAGSAEEDEQS